MSVENIEKRILESARAEANQLIEKAGQAARTRLDAARAGNEKLMKAAVEETEQLLQQELDRQATAARATNKLKLLTRKSQILDDIFNGAAERFIGDRGSRYREWLAGQLRAVSGHKGAIVPAAADRELVGKLLADVKERDGLSLSTESLDSLRGGFVLRGEKVDFDLSLDTQFAALKQELLPELAAKAFEELTTDEH